MYNMKMESSLCFEKEANLENTYLNKIKSSEPLDT